MLESAKQLNITRVVFKYLVLKDFLFNEHGHKLTDTGNLK